MGANRVRPTGRGLLVASMMAALVAGATPASAAGVCNAAFTVYFAPGLTGAGNTVQGGGTSALEQTGTLSCTGTGGTTASVTVGRTFTTPATDATDIANGISTYTWREPVGAVTGGCINNTANGDAVTRWNDGGISITRFRTDSFTYGIQLTGNGVASTVATAVEPAPGQPATYTIQATRDVGASAVAELVAATEDPQGAFTACTGNALIRVTLTGVEVFS